MENAAQAAHDFGLGLLGDSSLAGVNQVYNPSSIINLLSLLVMFRSLITGDPNSSVRLTSLVRSQNSKHRTETHRQASNVVEAIQKSFRRIQDSLEQEGSGIDIFKQNNMILYEGNEIDFKSDYFFRLMQQNKVDFATKDFPLYFRWWHLKHYSPGVVSSLINIAGQESAGLGTKEIFNAPWLDNYSPTTLLFPKGVESPAKRVLGFHGRAKVGYGNFELTDKSALGRFKAPLRLTVLRLPYSPNQGRDLSLFILMPISRSIEEMIQSLDGSSFKLIYRDLVSKEVSFVIPEFDLSTKFNLKKAINSEPIRKIFSDNQEATSVLEEFANSNHTVGLSSAELIVNEYGTESMRLPHSLKYQFNKVLENKGRVHVPIDRPFLFVVLYNHSQLPLYMGRVDEVDGELPVKSQIDVTFPFGRALNESQSQGY